MTVQTVVDNYSTTVQDSWPAVQYAHFGSSSTSADYKTRWAYKRELSCNVNSANTEGVISTSAHSFIQRMNATVGWKRFKITVQIFVFDLTFQLAICGIYMYSRAAPLVKSDDAKRRTLHVFVRAYRTSHDAGPTIIRLSAPFSSLTSNYEGRRASVNSASCPRHFRWRHIEMNNRRPTTSAPALTSTHFRHRQLIHKKATFRQCRPQCRPSAGCKFYNLKLHLRRWLYYFWNNAVYSELLQQSPNKSVAYLRGSNPQCLPPQRWQFFIGYLIAIHSK